MDGTRALPPRLLVGNVPVMIFLSLLAFSDLDLVNGTFSDFSHQSVHVMGFRGEDTQT